ncbi:ATP-binding protein [Actinomadura rifamycini]|uniref:ATP-binding protein n=1 Tax=Actinomadura rifamycini TaxID=31962 RepID=UPI0012FBC602|nr:ATP-binding protein [Actinomadura rifamycini]
MPPQGPIPPQHRVPQPGPTPPYRPYPQVPPGTDDAAAHGTRAASGAGPLDLPGPWYRIEAIPAPEGAASAERDFVSVLPAALSAARAERPFVVGWLSPGGGAPLELITNAGPIGAPGGTGPLFPSGARGVRIGDGWLRRAERMAWTRCPGRLAPQAAAAPPAADRPGAGLFESTLVTLMERPFGWFVVAEPCDERLVDAEMRELHHELRMLRRGEDEHARLAVGRTDRRLAELDAFREAGLWRVRVLAGAGDQDELGQIAPVLVGSMDLAHHPYRLRSGHGAGTFAEMLRPGAAPAPVRAAAEPDQRFPFVATAGALAALAGLPNREVPGLRVLDAGYFDVTSETAAETGPDGPGTIELGAILDGQDREVGRFTVPRSTVNRHVFVTGATGAGKSQTVRHLLEQLTRAGVPWLAIEPAKSEYAAMAGRIADLGGPVTVVNPSDPASVPLSVNPLAPEPGYPVQAHIDMVRALFQAAFDAEEPFPQIMAQALQRVYEANGWDVVTGAGVPGSLIEPAVPTLEQLQTAALQVIQDVGYGRELMADVQGFVDVRLRSLRIGSAGRFFEGGHPADIGGMLRDNIVLAIEDVANDEDKAFLMGTLIIRIVEHLRMRERRRGADRGRALRHVIVIEEAHRLLRNRGPERGSSHAVELFAGMLAEIRAYGEGIIVAEQIPTKLVPDVIKNTALKVVHRLPAHDDRHQVGAAMNLDADQSREVVSLRPGVAAVFADGMDRPLRVRVPLGEGREAELAGPPPPVDGRRSAACGCECRSGRACTLYELREADLVAGHPDWAWLRLWADVLVLAHVAGRRVPAVPPDLRRAWARLTPRLRDCALATVLERAVTRRSWALRTAFPPAELTGAVAGTARRLLDGQDAPGRVPGPNWVIPQVRWLHELDRLFPYGAETPDKHAPAPPLDYQLPGLKQQPDAKLGHRLRALRRHPLSMELERNRPLALTALYGEDDHAAFYGDLADVTIGFEEDEQIEHVAGTMDVSDWLEPVLSWPDRFVLPFGDPSAAPPFTAPGDDRPDG